MIDIFFPGNGEHEPVLEPRAPDGGDSDAAAADSARHHLAGAPIDQGDTATSESGSKDIMLKKQI